VSISEENCGDVLGLLERRGGRDVLVVRSRLEDGKEEGGDDEGRFSDAESGSGGK